MDDSSSTTVWAAHKCVVRGVFIYLLAKRNKIRKARIVELSEQLKTLERVHKLMLANRTHTELLAAREDLLEELQKSMKRNFALIDCSTNLGISRGNS